MTSPISTPSTLVMGSSGSGKTDCLATLIEAGLETFVLITEPNGLDSLLDSMERRALSIDKLHWKVVPPRHPGVKTLRESATKIHQLSYKDITNLSAGIAKSDCLQWFELLDNIENFYCDRTSKHFGDVTTWDSSRAFVIDSMSGINMMATQNTLGLRPMIQLAEYMIIQNTISQLLDELCSTDAFFVITAHVNKLIDELTSRMTIMVRSVGKALAPDIPTFFSEVVYAQRTGNSFVWSNISEGVDTKNRALPLRDDLTPSFVPIVERHRARQLLATGPSPDQTPTAEVAVAS